MAKVTSLATLAGEMHCAECDAYAAHLTHATIGSRTFDDLSLFLIVKGKVRYAYGDGQEMDVGAGGFFLLDGFRPASLHFSRHNVIQIDLLRPLLESVFSGSMPSPTLINAALASSRLGLFRDLRRR